MNNTIPKQHPYTTSAHAAFVFFHKVFVWFIVGFIMLGLIMALIVSSAHSSIRDDNYTEYVVIHIGGFEIGVVETDFLASSGVLFLNVFLSNIIFSIILICIEFLIRIFFKTIFNILDSVYRTEILTQEIVRNQTVIDDNELSAENIPS